MSDTLPGAAAAAALNLEPVDAVCACRIFFIAFFRKIRLQSAVNFYGATVVVAASTAAAVAMFLLDLLAHLRFNWPFIGWPRRLAK